MGARPTYSLVIPIFNEEAVVPMLLLRLDRLLAVLDGPAEIIFVDDGSTDCSAIVLRDRARRDDRFKLMRLSRNFGHQIAITAGLDYARGDAVIVMDGDLQDPPEVVLQLVAKWREGFDVVCARRVAREGESRFKEATAKLFYRAVQRLSSIDIPLDVGDFRLVDRKALDCFVTMRERKRFVRGMFAWLGFNCATIPYARAPRAAGATKYPLRRMLRLAADALIGFSDAPLQFALWAGGAVSAGAAGFGLYLGSRLVFGAAPPSGWEASIFVTAALCGANMILTGLLGLYVGRIFTEVKGRPLYLVEEATGFEATPRATDGAAIVRAVGE